MKTITLFRIGFLLLLVAAFSSSTSAQHLTTTNKRALIQPFNSTFGLEGNERTASQPEISSFPTSPFSALVSVPGATSMGITGKYHSQTAHGGLHNIQVDPSDPTKIHAVIMTALNVTKADTTAAANFPQRNIFYTYSADGGITWKPAKKIAPFRAGFPSMILYKRNGVYVPIIGAHRYTTATSKQFISALYVEKGAPGDGNFQETAADMSTAEQDTKEILWPSIAISPDNTKVYMVSAVLHNAVGDQLYHLQFSVFTLSADGTATWGLWKKGPSYDLDNGLCTAGDYVVNVSKSGKIGIVWHAFDFNTPDRSVYFSESNDDGTTWSSPITVYTPVAATNSSNGGTSLDAVSLDFFYGNDEKANIAIGAQYELGTETNNTYIPASGSLLFWRSGMAVPVYIMSRESDNDFQGSQLDGSWLSDWNNTMGIDPQGPNIENPTLVRGIGDNSLSIYFEAWAQDDTGTYLLPPPFVNVDGGDTSIKYPYHGIYRVDSHDGGNTFSGPFTVKANVVTDPQDNKIDCRFPEVSSSSNGFNFAIMYGVDSAAGLTVPTNPGLPGYDDLSWFFQKNSRASVKASSSENISLSQNFPNPFIGSTAIPVDMKNDEIVTLTVTDILGREIATLYHGRLSAGVHNIPFTASNIGAGIYTYSLKTAAGSISRTMSIVK